MPHRATPADYQAHAQAGAITIAAESKGHSIPTPLGTLTTTDYLVIEAALFGPPDSRLLLSVGDFSLRVNGKKNILPGQPFGMVFRSLKDPELEPPSSSKSKSNLSTGGSGQADSGAPPAPVKIPVETVRSMQQRTRQASLTEGDRLLPQAGLIYFQYSGKVDGIRSLELIYNGPAGAATLTLEP